MHILYPFLFFIFSLLSTLFLVSFDYITNSLSYIIVLIAIIWSIVFLVIEIISVFNKSNFVNSTLNKIRKISIALFLIPGLFIFSNSFIYISKSLFELKNSPNIGYLPLFLPLYILPVIFIILSVILIIATIVKIKNYIKSQK